MLLFKKFYSFNALRKTAFEMWVNSVFFISNNFFLLYQRLIPLTLSQTTNFIHFKVKDFASNTFKFDENGRKFFKQV